jgi:hypothetical protein
VILHCADRGYLDARVELCAERLLALAPDTDVGLVGRHLAAIPRMCAGGLDAGPIGRLSQAERWRWLTAPRSTILQVSPAHVGLCESPEAALEALLDKLVRPRERGLVFAPG